MLISTYVYGPIIKYVDLFYKLNCGNAPNNTNNLEGYGVDLTINTNITSHNIYYVKY